MLGDQIVSPSNNPLPPPCGRAFHLARASVATTSPTRVISASSQVAASPIACGNTVASPLRARPCSPSFHQS